MFRRNRLNRNGFLLIALFAVIIFSSQNLLLIFNVVTRAAIRILAMSLSQLAVL